MTRWAGVLLVAGATLAGAGTAFAQELRPTEGKVVLTIMPAGATFFTESKSTQGPSFSNYDLGGAAAVNFNRYVGLEGEVSGRLGVTQDLGSVYLNSKTPNMLNYSGNVIVNATNHSAVIPYATGGIGGLSVFETASLGIPGTETFLTGNVGGGVKWNAGRVGVRGDYRFLIVQSKDDAPVFFGQETRYGHRIYGAVTVNVGR